MKKPGDPIQINGHQYTLGERIGGGTEGNVFRLVEKPGALAKLIDVNRKTERQIADERKHLQKLVDICQSITNTKELSVRTFAALPQALLDNELGYVMKEAANREPISAYLNVPETDSGAWYVSHGLYKRYQIIHELFRALQVIHLAGLVFTDLSPNNILTSPKANDIVFIDTDNLRTRDDPFLNVLGTPGYMAPELFSGIPSEASVLTDEEKAEIKQGIVTPESDIFSAAVIAFQLLVFNHPFIGDLVDNGSQEDEEAAYRGAFDYIFKPGTKNNRTGNVFVDRYERITTKEIRELFKRTFVDGKNVALSRPTDLEFIDAFERGLSLIVKCPYCGTENIYNLVLDKDEKCVADAKCFDPDCDKNIPTQQILSVYAKGKEGPLEEVILGEVGIGPDEKQIPISRKVLHHSDSWPDCIYLSDIGAGIGNRKDDLIGAIKISKDNPDFVVFRLLSNENVEIKAVVAPLDPHSEKIVPVAPNSETSFAYKRHYVVLQGNSLKHGKFFVYSKVEDI